MSVIAEHPIQLARKTKIIATLGPVSSSPAVIYDLINAGVNIFRLNMSHGSYAEHQRLFTLVREAGQQLNQTLMIFADLCGPKIRVGKFRSGSIQLQKDAIVTVTTREIMGDVNLIPCQYTALANDLVVGDRILLDDGKLELQVVGIEDQDVSCLVKYGGELSNHKGMNLPGVNVSCASLTEKDRADAVFALDLGVDYLALSFVRTAHDVKQLRDLIAAHDSDTHIIAKIERLEAWENSRQIIIAADAVMIARGDLGVEMNPEDVPIIQQQLIKKARALNKPVIVATQMLESMIHCSRPTRAEATDVSSAVSAGTDAVMLSAETAAGSYPVEAVLMMDRIITQTEVFMLSQGVFNALTQNDREGESIPFRDAVADATAKFCANLHAKAIVAITHGGRTVITLSSARPVAPLIAVSASIRVCQRMVLYWGVMPVYSTNVGHMHPNILARELARNIDFIVEGDTIILVRGFNDDSHMNTPTITMLSL